MSKAFLVVMMGISLKGWGGGGSLHPPYCFRSSSILGLVPFAVACADVDAALFVGGRLGLGAGLRDDETSGLTGFFRRGRRGFGFWVRGGPLGFPEGALILMLGRALTTEI